MRMPENAISGRIKLRSYFIVSIGSRYYCKIIINNIEMFAKILRNINDGSTSETISQKFLEGEWIDVAVMRGKPVEKITEEQYNQSQHYKIRLETENNSEWVSVK